MGHTIKCSGGCGATNYVHESTMGFTCHDCVEGITPLRDRIAALEAKVARLEKLRDIGAQLANVAFNVSQPSVTLDAYSRNVLKRLYAEWDATCRAAGDLPTEGK